MSKLHLVFGGRVSDPQGTDFVDLHNVDVVGLSILSGSHLELVPMVLDGLRDAGLGDVPVVVGGIIPDTDAETLRSLGVAAVFTPKDYDATAIMARVLDEVRAARGLPRLVGASA